MKKEKYGKNKNLDRYLDLCYNTLDVARSYKNGLCEEFLGEYLKNRKGGFSKVEKLNESLIGVDLRLKNKEIEFLDRGE